MASGKHSDRRENDKQDFFSLRHPEWLRLRESYLFDPLSARKLLKLAYLTAALVMPESMKRKLYPFAARLRTLLMARSDSSAVTPYHVNTLQPLLMQRPRIVHALANFATGGSSRLVVDLIEHLGHRYEQEVLTGLNPSPPHYTGVKVHSFPRHAGSDNILAYLSAFRPSLLHVHYWGESDRAWYQQVFSAAKRLRCRVIENVNTPVDPYFGDMVAQYVYVSDFVRRTFGRDDGLSRTIYPGCNFDVFARRDTSVPPDDCIGMVYRLEADKLDERSIDVFLKVAQRRPGTRILIVGGGTFLGRYSAAAAKAGVSGSFTFTGYVPYHALPSLYEQMSIFVAPVWKESFGQVSPFAMHMAIPVVGYDIGAIPEIIGDRELLSAPGDSEGLAGVIIALLDDRQRRLAIGKKNRDRAEALFSVQAMIDRYAQLYGSLLRGEA